MYQICLELQFQTFCLSGQPNKCTDLGFIKYDHCSCGENIALANLLGNIRSPWSILRESSFLMGLLLMFKTPLSIIWWGVHVSQLILFSF